MKLVWTESVAGARDDHRSGRCHEHPPQAGQDDHQEQGPRHPRVPQVCSTEVGTFLMYAFLHILYRIHNKN